MRGFVNIVGLGLITFSLSGCLPFFGAQDDAKAFVKQKQDEAARKEKGTIPNIREMKKYEDYTYKITLVDPFTLKDFVEERQGDEGLATVCTDCDSPPKDHIAGILESYEISALRFVGVLKNNNAVALIQTPDLGVLEARLGDFIGKDYGKIITIDESSMVIQEKKKQGTQWRDQKKILVINK